MGQFYFGDFLIEVGQDSTGVDTVIEAAASDYRLLRAEAMIDAARAAQAAAEASSSNDQLARKAQAAQYAAGIAHQRLRLRQRHGHPGSIQLSPLEPEAAVQLGKDGLSVLPTNPP